MKILLLNPPYSSNYVRSSRCTWIPIAGSNWYPIFLAYATGLLEKKGHNAKLWDALVDGTTPEKLIDGVKDFNPEVILMYTSLDSLKNDVGVAEDIKSKHSCKIIFVGPWCSSDPVSIISKSLAIDGVIRREFEYPSLLIANKVPWGDIPSLVWRDNEKIRENEGDYFLSNEELEELPFVSEIYKKYLNLENYYQTSLKFPFVDMFTARGCAWGKCIFCLWPQTIHKGAPYRYRSISNVIEEIKYIKKHLPKVKEIFFQDDMLPRSRIKEMSQAILDNNIKIIWSGYAKADLDYETMKIARKSGCRFLHIGYESANQNILNVTEKGEIVEKMEVFTRDAKRAKLSIHGDFIIGLPGETEETIKETIVWAKKINISDYQFVVPQPHPATKFYKYLKSNNYLTEDEKANYPGLSPEKMEYWRFKAYKDIYFSPKYIITRLLEGMRRPKEFVRLYGMAKKGLPMLFSNLKKYKNLNK